MKKVNIIEKLQEVQEKEKKRRDVAVKYLKELVDILEPIFMDIEGEKIQSDMISPELQVDAFWIPIWDKEKETYSNKKTDLYFRYNSHHGETDSENPGFYVSTNYFKIWGQNLLDIKGEEFWIQIKRITDWAQNYLPDYIDKQDRSRDQRMAEFEQLVNRLGK